jgi:manganese/zinc/iron transport system permease protein
MGASIPTGPTIVLAATALVLFSFLFAPLRGIVWNRVGSARRRRALRAAVGAGTGYGVAGTPLTGGDRQEEGG